MSALPIRPRERHRRAPAALLAEAGAAIVVASVAIRLRPFRTVVAALDRAGGPAPAADAETAYWVRRVVTAWGRRLPWRARCFEQGLAAAWMLRRRGLAALVHYGAANDEQGLRAHVWVTSDERPVVGCENREEFALLATFGGGQ